MQIIHRGLKVIYRVRFALFLSWAVLHLCLALFSAGGLHLKSGVLGKAINYYSTVTGTDREYGFFAPNSKAETRVVFEIVDEAGRRSRHTLDEMATREAQLRFADIFGRLWVFFEAKNPQLRNAITASWAGQMFGRYPEARKITVIFEAYELKSADQYRKGERSEWVKIYEAKYAKPV